MQPGLNFWIAGRLSRRFYYGWTVATVAFVANLSVYSINPTFGLFITPLEQAFGWERSVIARSITLGTVLGAVLAPGLGVLLDRLGTRLPMIVLGLAGTAGFLLLSRVHEVWQFNVLVSLLYGCLFVGVGQMIGSVNLTRWFVRRRGRAMGTVMMGASLGAVIFIPLCTVLIGTVGWRATYATLGGMSLLLVCLPAFLLLVDRPEQLGLAQHEELQPLSAARGAPSAAKRRPAPGGSEVSLSLRQAARMRAFWLLMLGFMLGTAAVQGYFVHAVPHMESRGFSRTLVSAVWSTFFVTGVAAKFLWGFVIERIGVRWGLVALYGFEALGILLLLTARSPLALFVYAVANGLGHGPYLQLQAMAWAEYFGRHSIGRIYGVVQPAIIVSGSMGPWLGGFFFDWYGDYTRFFEIGIALCLAAMAVFFLAPPPGRQPARAGAALPA